MHARSIDGKQRSEKVANEIVTDVSKLLKFAGGQSSDKPDWGRLSDRDIVLAYLSRVEQAGCGVEGRLSKLDAFEAALTFLRLVVLKDKETDEWYRKTKKMSDILVACKATLRKQKSRKRVARMESLSDEALNLDDIDEILNHPKLWDFIAAVEEDVESGAAVSSKNLNRCTTIIAALLNFRSWQRPGAATNALLSEFSTVREETQGNKIVHVLKVKDHKTGISGATRIIMTGKDYHRLDSYVSTIRPRLLGSNTWDNLLILEGGGKVVNFNQRLQKVCTFFACRT